MATLNAWQKLSRLGLSEFGSGDDGAYSSATIPTMTYRSCSGTSGSTTLTLGSSGYSNGDILLIHQSRGTGVGQWEINKISSGGGTTSLTLTKTLQYTYTDSGSSQAQCVKIPQYTDVTVQSGTWTVSDWGGDTGGILVFAANGTLTVTGTINADGKGFTGGARGEGANNSTANGKQGEGTAAAGGTSTYTANGNGGGGSNRSTYDGGHGGGGGAGGAAGSNGGQVFGSGSGNVGVGGSVIGQDDGTAIVFGGGGGGGGGDGVTGTSAPGGGGSDGGGMVIAYAKTVQVNGTITVDGVAGVAATAGDGNTHTGGGGGGGGGSVLFVGKDVNIGSSLVACLAGSGGAKINAGGVGGDGGKGRVTIHYATSTSGSIAASGGVFTTVQDPTLSPAGGAWFMFM